MDVAQSPCIGCGPHRRTVLRSGGWIREERTYSDRTETRYADLSTATTYRIVRDRAGTVQSLKVERARRGDALASAVRSATGRRDTALGEACEVWRTTGRYLDEESCETADGIQLWSRHPSASGDLEAARTVSIERRPVRPEEVRPPPDFFRLAPWPVTADAAQPGYEVELVSTTRGHERRLVERAQGAVASGSRDDDDGTRSFWGTSDQSRFLYREEADGRPLELEVTLWSIDWSGRRIAPTWAPLRRHSEAVLGERCTWQEDTSFRSSDRISQCRSRDGIPLMIEFDWHWDSVTDVYVASRVTRRRLTPADLAPPRASVDAAIWQSPP